LWYAKFRQKTDLEKAASAQYLGNFTKLAKKRFVYLSNSFSPGNKKSQRFVLAHKKTGLARFLEFV
jgi:hypothetical protein